jgi:hypothetical protein
VRSELESELPVPRGIELSRVRNGSEAQLISRSVRAQRGDRVGAPRERFRHHLSLLLSINFAC